MSRMPTQTHTRIRTGDTALPADPSVMRLLHLASPALPIGAFHFSQGLEYAVEAGWVRDEPTTLDWIEGIAQSSFCTLDIPVLHRLHVAWRRSDDAALLYWNAFLIASRETEELRAEDRHLGSALLRVLGEFGLRTELFSGGASKGPLGISHATAFSLACARWDIGARDAAQAFAWSWLENQVLAAVKLVPLGQSAGQRILHTVVTRLGVLCERSAALLDSDIGISTAASAVASARHETQYTRLFRS
jgi:urease accessory protein